MKLGRLPILLVAPLFGCLMVNSVAGLTLKTPHRQLSALFLKNQCINHMLGVDRTEGVMSLCESVTSLTQRERAVVGELDQLKKEHAQLQWSLKDSAEHRRQLGWVNRENSALNAKVRSLEGENHKLAISVTRLSQAKQKASTSEQQLLLLQAADKKQEALDKAKGLAAERGLVEANEEATRARAAAVVEAARNRKLRAELEAAKKQNAALVSKMEAVTTALEGLSAKDAADRMLLVKQMDALREENKIMMKQFGR